VRSVIGEHPGCGGVLRRLTAAETVLQRHLAATDPQRQLELDRGLWGVCETCQMLVKVVISPRR
jgi:hypothetical protein